MTRLRTAGPLLAAAGLAVLAVVSIRTAGCDDPGRYEAAAGRHVRAGRRLSRAGRPGPVAARPDAGGRRPSPTRSRPLPELGTPAEAEPGRSGCGGQSVPQVVDEVVDGLDPDREPDEVPGTSCCEPATERCVMSAGMLDERLHAAERLGQGE